MTQWTQKTGWMVWSAAGAEGAMVISGTMVLGSVPFSSYRTTIEKKRCRFRFIGASISAPIRPYWPKNICLLSVLKSIYNHSLHRQGIRLLPILFLILPISVISRNELNLQRKYLHLSWPFLLNPIHSSLNLFYEGKLLSSCLFFQPTKCGLNWQSSPPLVTSPIFQSSRMEPMKHR
jgi:hypothetical protein